MFVRTFLLIACARDGLEGHAVSLLEPRGQAIFRRCLPTETGLDSCRYHGEPSLGASGKSLTLIHWWPEFPELKARKGTKQFLPSGTGSPSTRACQEVIPHGLNLRVHGWLIKPSDLQLTLGFAVSLVTFVAQAGLRAHSNPPVAAS